MVDIASEIDENELANIMEESELPILGVPLGIPQKIYSIFWRRNRSHQEALELATVLAAMRKVAGFIGKNAKPVYWDGMPSSKKNAIILNPAQVQGNYPVPFAIIDLLVGQVIYESFLGIEWSDWVKNQVRQGTTPLAQDIEPYFYNFLMIGEEIYLDELVRSEVWSFYLTKYFQSLSSKAERRDPTLPPVAKSLLSFWRKMIFLHIQSPDLHYYYDDLMTILTDCSPRIREIAKKPTTLERRKERVQTYLEIWTQIYGVILEWEKFDQSTDGVMMKDESGPKVPNPDSEDEQDEDNTINEEEEGPLSETMRPELAEEIGNILDEGKTDLTEFILAVTENPREEVMATIFSRAVAECTAFVNEDHVNRLKKIFEKQQRLIRISRKKRIRRGLECGKLDARRLYRTPYNEKIFKKKENINSDHSWNIAIVADSSASMGRRTGAISSWSLAEQTFASLTEAVKRSSNQLEVYGYCEKSGQCHVVRLYRGSKLFTVYPEGQTPSGQALLAAAMMMSKNRTKRLMIHITDGAANCGIRVSEAADYCHKNHIELITIGCGHSEETQELLKEQYSKGLYLMDDIRGLPIGMEKLFRERLLRL